MNATPPATRRVDVFAVPGLGEFTTGDDLAAHLITALADLGHPLVDGDLVIVASKVVAKVEGRTLTADTRDAAIAEQTVRVVAERTTDAGATRVVVSRSGPVLAAAGVDASNVPAGQVLLLPADPDASARALRRRLQELSGARLGVVISDTAGRPWRQGQTDLAIGAAGVAVLDDLRGAHDGHGNPLRVTVRALADELAAAADLVKGKVTGAPVAVIRGLGALVVDDDGPGARALLRDGADDWFRLGHSEAVRSALGAPPGTPGIPPAPLLAGSAVDRLHRALDVALAGPDLIVGPGRTEPWLATVLSESFTVGMVRQLGDRAPARIAEVTAPDHVTDPVVLAVVVAAGRPAGAPAATNEDVLALGAFVQRTITAAWAEDLDLRASLREDGAILLVGVTTET